MPSKHGKHFEHAPARAADLDAFERDVTRAARVRSLLVTWHLPTVLSVARRHLVGQSDPNASVASSRCSKRAIRCSSKRSRPTTPPPGRRSMRCSPTACCKAFAAAQQTNRAQRRESAADVVKRMIDLAGESGVYLAIGEMRCRRKN